MNIGIVTTWFERGAAYVSKAYMQALSRKHSVFVYARGGEAYACGDSRWDKEFVTWGKQVPGMINTYVDWRDFRGWVTDNRLEIVIFNEQHSWKVVVKTRKKLNVAVGAYVDYYTSESVRLHHIYDFLICNTKRHYDVFRRHQQVFFIPWGTDCKVFDGSLEPVSPNRLVFFHSAGMGGINNRKGTDILVRAFQNVTGSAELVIHSQVGPEHFPTVTPLIQRDARIRFIMATVTAPGLYHLGDVYVYPTRLEGIGLTVAEALASGLPVITTDAPPMNEFVIHDLNGRLVKVERYQARSDRYYWPESICSEQALTEAMQYYVDHMSDITDYKATARRYAEAHLNWEANSYKLADLMENIDRPPQQPSRKLTRAAARYERSMHRYPWIPTALQIALHKMGVGRIKRKLGELTTPQRRNR